MLNKLLPLAVAALLLMPASLYAQGNSVQRYVDSVMRVTPELKNAAVAILAVDGRGKTVAQWNPDLPLIPASTMKTITTGAALVALGPGFRFETRLASAGAVDEDGILHGDLYIIGGADPTLASRIEAAQEISEVFSGWAEAIREAGIIAIDGKVIGDASIFGGDVIQDKWFWEDLGAGYGSFASGLAYAENLSYYRVEPAQEEGAPLMITPVESVYSKMNVAQQAVTGASKTGDRLVYYASDLSPVGRFTGTYALDRKVDTIAVSNKFPALTCAEDFGRFLEEEGILSCGVSLGAAPDTAVILAVTRSPELLEICRETNTKSNNFFAETMFLTMGARLTGEVSYSSAPQAVEQFIQDLGCYTNGLRQDDGSGLSRVNYVSPRFFCNFFRMMQKSDIFAGYLATFPRPGDEGTMKNVLSKEPGQLRSCIHCKSGSMTAVKCYAGYVETVDGDLLRFAIMVNNYDCPTSRIQPKIEGFLKQLALYERQ